MSKTLFGNQGLGVAYSALQNCWTAAGQGGNSLAYSTDGIAWTGRGTSIISDYGLGVAYSAFQNRWVAAGNGTGNTLAYSTDGIAWTGLGNSIFSAQGQGIAYSTSQNRWTAAGQGTGGTGNTLAYSTDGIVWTGRGINIFSTFGSGVAYSDPPPFPTTNLLFDFYAGSGTSSTTNGASLTTWTDKRMNITATGTGAIYNTSIQNGLPMISSGALTTPTISTGNINNFTYFCVIKWDTNTGSTLTTTSILCSNANSGLQIKYGTNNGGLSIIYNSVAWGAIASTATFSVGSVYILAITYSFNGTTSTTTYRVNGVDYTPATNTATTNNVIAQGGYSVSLANNSNGTPPANAGYIGEQILFNTTLPLSSIQNIERSLAYTWGIAIGSTPTIPSSSPYSG
jgi:hypothetical protein